ncbi:LytR/AlgR family response regulator transcription factor [Winogradskyella haliclonae]|uniref:DNA-binding response regulator n=1 Tax=Winogradskyella haliclonae TaxID=2048558 RepID=A0ABQ2BUQ5_9FLAO|nr:LytTR family DNA-binding domain-containing protein [Winogradskyella haliclonae]GGI56175.1 DNA-binding response regulator [Winogradskyella haliclonae]
MKSIIIDDEATARSIIEHLGSQNNDVEIIEAFPSAIEAIKYLNQEEIELIFLDIHMPAFTGFDFIQTLKDPPKIIITTSDKNFALDAFEYDCIIDYLVKPITQERFDKAIKKAKNKTLNTTTVETSSSNDLYVNIDRRLVKINIPDIYFIQAKGDYIKIVTEDKNLIVHATLKKIEDKLPDSLFLKVHRSYVINTKKIIDIEDNSVLIKQDIVPVSRSNRSELMRRLNLL